MSQISTVKSEDSLLQHLLKNEDIDLHSYILSILTVWAQEEEESKLKEETRQQLEENRIIETAIDTRRHNHLVEILEEAGIPVAYRKFDETPPDYPYIIFKNAIVKELSSNEEKHHDHYKISLYTSNEDHSRMKERLEHALNRNGYQIENQVSIVNVPPDEHVVSLYCVKEQIKGQARRLKKPDDSDRDDRSQYEIVKVHVSQKDKYSVSKWT